MRDARAGGCVALAAPLLRDHLRRAHLLLCALAAALVCTTIIYKIILVIIQFTHVFMKIQRGEILRLEP